MSHFTTNPFPEAYASRTLFDLSGTYLKDMLEFLGISRTYNSLIVPGDNKTSLTLPTDNVAYMLAIHGAEYCLAYVEEITNENRDRSYFALKPPFTLDELLDSSAEETQGCHNTFPLDFSKTLFVHNTMADFFEKPTDALNFKNIYEYQQYYNELPLGQTLSPYPNSVLFLEQPAHIAISPYHTPTKNIFMSAELANYLYAMFGSSYQKAYFSTIKPIPKP